MRSDDTVQRSSCQKSDPVCCAAASLFRTYRHLGSDSATGQFKGDRKGDHEKGRRTMNASELENVEWLSDEGRRMKCLCCEFLGTERC